MLFERVDRDVPEPLGPPHRIAERHGAAADDDRSDRGEVLRVGDLVPQADRQVFQRIGPGEEPNLAQAPERGRGGGS